MDLYLSATDIAFKKNVSIRTVRNWLEITGLEPVGSQHKPTRGYDAKTYDVLQLDSLLADYKDRQRKGRKFNNTKTGIRKLLAQLTPEDAKDMISSIAAGLDNGNT
jgi:DNA-binding transcriptional MerR regulator